MACAADDATIGNRGQVPIILTTAMESGTATRAATNVLSSTQFGADETFYACFSAEARVGGVVGGGTTFTTSGTGATTPVSQPYFTDAASSATVYAYYPYVTGKQVTETSTSFSVETDQTSEAGYKKSDLMYATATVTKNGTSGTGVLHFAHKMSKIVVNVTAGEGVSSITGVYVIGGNRTIALSSDGACTLGATSDALSVNSPLTMYTGSGTSASCAALIPPQTITGSFLIITTNLGNAVCSLSGKTFNSGGSYTYMLTVSSTDIGLATDITNWGEERILLVNESMSSFDERVEAVDLGLSVKWAARNIGATCVTDFGTYFAWGETSGYTVVGATDTPAPGNEKTLFDWTTYTLCNGYWSGLTKYTTGDGKIQLDLSDDAAYVNWGDDWRMPTMQECQELSATKNNTTDYTWIWKIDYNGVSGCRGWLITYNQTGASIFLPAAGCYDGSAIDNINSGGYYWASERNTNTSDVHNGCYLSFSDDFVYVSSYHLRCRGCNIRAVQP